jgi:hypothetical protein
MVNLFEVLQIGALSISQMSSHNSWLVLWNFEWLSIFQSKIMLYHHVTWFYNAQTLINAQHNSVSS